MHTLTNGKTKRFRFLQIAILATPLLATATFAANQVVVNSKAHEDFSITREQDESNTPVTYTFMKGKFHGGNRADPAMDDFPFNEVVLDIATHLKKQNFNPIPNPNDADLVIVVHYGVTSVQENQEDLLGYTSLEDFEFVEGDPGGGAATGAALESIQNYQFNVNASTAIKESNQSGLFYTSKLIGMEKAFVGHASPREEHELKNMLNERRYFIVLMAYDFPLMKEGQVHMHWTTRYSIRAIGQTFDQAIKDMNLVAGNYFGKNMGDIVKKRVTDKSRVKLGKIELIGEEKEPSN